LEFLRVSRTKSEELVKAISAVMDRKQIGNSGKLDQFDLWSIHSKSRELRVILLSEIGTLPTYLVSRKEGYDTDVLVQSGASLFPSSLTRKVPEARPDAMEAGKALAFEVATACGFHVFRVTECVLRRYWDQVSDGSPRPRLQTMGNFALEMEKSSIGDPKIVESIKQMTKLHRNPLIHPEVMLTVEEAISIIGIARSVVGAMLVVLPDVQPTTTNAAATSI
jgi:hypothetical protein